jgi:hypothetical protein
LSAGVKVFISWSGTESKQVAEALRDWLPMVFETVQPYMSARDNEAGVRWSGVVAAELDDSDFGILCCTRSNLTAPWLNFEAGALSKAVAVARVVPQLHNLVPADIGSPLSQFMAKRDDRAGVRDVVRAINEGLERPRSAAALDGVFEAMWPGLEAKLAEVAPGDADPAPTRPDRELLEEMLQLLRGEARERARRERTEHAPPEVLRKSAADVVRRLSEDIDVIAGPGAFLDVSKSADSVRLHLPDDLPAAETRLLKRMVSREMAKWIQSEVTVVTFPAVDPLADDDE